MIPAHDTEFVKRLPELIKLLSGVKTIYGTDERYIGEAITYLRLLHGLAISDSGVSSDSGNQYIDINSIGTKIGCPCGSGKCGACD